jgi:leucyl/phenylalanyl-tRNA--protein transferase
MLDVRDPPRFPPAWKARADGLLMVGGQLTTDWLLAAYRQGIFPWPLFDGQSHVLAWFSPDPRAVLELDGLHVSHRLRRRMRSGRFQVSFDADFPAVVAGCAEPRGPDDGTWITPAMAAGYNQLHQLGCAHSVEIWQDGELVGGLYGVALGGFFSGESMFHRVRDASKVALAYLVQRLREHHFVLFDVQQASPHLRRMGATEIPRREFLARLKKSLQLPVSLADTPESTC